MAVTRKEGLVISSAGVQFFIDADGQNALVKVGYEALVDRGGAVITSTDNRDEVLRSLFLTYEAKIMNAVERKIVQRDCQPDGSIYISARDF